MERDQFVYYMHHSPLIFALREASKLIQGQIPSRGTRSNNVTVLLMDHFPCANSNYLKISVFWFPVPPASLLSSSLYVCFVDFADV